MMHNITYVQNISLVVHIRLGRYLYTFNLNYENSLAADELEEVAGEMLSSMRNAMSKDSITCSIDDTGHQLGWLDWTV